MYQDCTGKWAKIQVPCPRHLGILERMAALFRHTGLRELFPAAGVYLSEEKISTRSNCYENKIPYRDSGNGARPAGERMHTDYHQSGGSTASAYLERCRQRAGLPGSRYRLYLHWRAS